MKKGAKILCGLLVLCFVFMLGWRGMPKVWPEIKRNLACRIIPSSHPVPETETEAEPNLYTPKSNYQYGDEISDSDSLIYYFYKDYCPYCKALEPLTAGLPAEITLPDGTPSKVKMLCLNKVEDEYLRIITDYYDEHDIPEEERYVPAIVIGDRYLFLEEEIVPQLMEALVAGEGLQTQMLDGAQRTGSSPAAGVSSQETESDTAA